MTSDPTAVLTDKRDIAVPVLEDRLRLQRTKKRLRWLGVAVLTVQLGAIIVASP